MKLVHSSMEEVWHKVNRTRNRQLMLYSSSNTTIRLGKAFNLKKFMTSHPCMEKHLFT